jgi:hypothetical protein
MSKRGPASKWLARSNQPVSSMLNTSGAESLHRIVKRYEECRVT